MCALCRYAGAQQADNYVLITHGLLMRIFCMCYLRWTVTEFEQVWNPSNCEIWVLEAIPNSARYELAGRWRATPYGGAFTDIKFGESRNQPLFEHMKRPLSSRSVTPGTPDALDSDELVRLTRSKGTRPRPLFARGCRHPRDAPRTDGERERGREVEG